MGKTRLISENQIILRWQIKPSFLRTVQLLKHFMTIKDLIKAALLCCCLAPSAVFAQHGQRSPEERANRQTEWMRKNLSISSDQATKVHDIILVHVRALENAPRGGDRRELMRTEMEARNKELRGVLTADQYARYQQHEDEMREKMQERRAAKQ